MSKVKILWADDEIDLLKPQILFLESKGYDVEGVTNAYDAIEKIGENDYSIIFLDEQMPGISGIEALSEIKKKKPHLPIVMITKSEEENLMDDAIGSKISDYLIKPVNPNQVWLSVKKILDNKRLVTEKSTMAYQQEFRNIGMMLGDNLSYQEWIDIYQQLVYWELELQGSEDPGISEILSMQVNEANTNFSKFIIKNYSDLLAMANEGNLTMSHNLMKKEVFPALEGGKPIFFILIDNLRLDQWRTIQPIIDQYLKPQEEKFMYSILPTTTQYSRNAIFSGMMPSNIAKQYPDYWLHDDEEGGKNMHEEFFIKNLVKNVVRKPLSLNYYKVLNNEFGYKVNKNLGNLLSNDLNVIVYNFVDILSHARTDIDIIKELAGNEAAYRTTTSSWFEHSPLLDLVKSLSEEDVHVFFATDHGTIRVKNPVKVVGDRTTTTNLRYKHGRNLQYDPDKVYDTVKPSELGLPTPHINSKFIFAKEYDYFVYPNNYNQYVNYYNNTFQHGGISMEEMIVPLAQYTSR